MCVQPSVCTFLNIHFTSICRSHWHVTNAQWPPGTVLQRGTYFIWLQASKPQQTPGCHRRLGGGTLTPTTVGRPELDSGKNFLSLKQQLSSPGSLARWHRGLNADPNKWECCPEVWGRNPGDQNWISVHTLDFVGLPWWLSKESACNERDQGLIPGLGRSPGEGNGFPLQYSCLENSMDRGAWQATVHGVAKSQTPLSANNFTFYGTHSTWSGALGEYFWFKWRLTVSLLTRYFNGRNRKAWT